MRICFTNKKSCVNNPTLFSLLRFNVHMRDLESALTFIFTREIVIKKILHKENLERFVDLLVKVTATYFVILVIYFFRRLLGSKVIHYC